jgi:hypothetical protein
MIATASVAAAVLTKALPKARARPISQSVRADARNAKALSAFVANFPGFEEARGAASRESFADPRAFASRRGASSADR